jgi:hypothetical protein
MEPEAVTENVAVIPEGTVWFWGCVVMVGGVPDMPPQAVKPKESVQPSKSTKSLGWVNASPRARVLVAQPTKRIHRPAVLTGRRIEQVVGCACFEGKEIIFHGHRHSGYQWPVSSHHCSQAATAKVEVLPHRYTTMSDNGCRMAVAADSGHSIALS